VTGPVLVAVADGSLRETEMIRIFPAPVSASAVKELSSPGVDPESHAPSKARAVKIERVFDLPINTSCNDFDVVIAWDQENAMQFITQHEFSDSKRHQNDKPRPIKPRF
jgi:hypothetical protein